LDGDEAALVKLFEKAYINFGGYSKKTPGCWRWSCLQRPDMEKNGIIVALDDNRKEIVGYVVAGKSGYVWELSYDPEYDGEEVVSLLLDKATAYIEAAGASSVNFNAPQEDAVIKRVCQKRGFAASDPPKMFLSVLSLQGLLSSLAYNKVNELTKKYNEIILIKISDAPFWLNAAIDVRINQSGIKVERGSQAYTVLLKTDYTTFSSILFGNMSPLIAFVHAKLKVKPLSKIFTVLKLLSNLQVKDEWYYPLSDYG
jgi:putative sterol carrier protein